MVLLLVIIRSSSLTRCRKTKECHSRGFLELSVGGGKVLQQGVFVTANRQVRNPRMGVSTKLVGRQDGTEIGGHNPLFFFLFLGIILDIY